MEPSQRAPQPPELLERIEQLGAALDELGDAGRLRTRAGREFGEQRLDPLAGLLRIVACGHQPSLSTACTS